MFGGVGKSAGWATILGAVGVVLGGSVSATAADLGGDCCADLEERVAELEATTARKGNRKVSLKISGWVNEAVFWWDDGTEKNVYVGTNDLEQTRFRFVGEAKIDKDWSAGYTLEIGTDGAGSSGFTQAADNATNGLTIRKSNWFVKSKTYGKFTVGQEGTATYHLLDDADGANTRNFSDYQAAGVAMRAWQLRSNGAPVNSLTWNNIMHGPDNDSVGQSTRLNIVRYDSPTFAGFTASTAWGVDDVWDAKLNYKGELGDFALVGQVGYGRNSTETKLNCSASDAIHADCRWFGAAGTIMHKPTGLYVYGGYAKERDDSRALLAPAGANVDKDDTSWFVQTGIEQKWMPLGKTTVFGEFRHDDWGSNPSLNTTGGATTTANFLRGSDLDFWAGGAVQHIDAAALDFYLIYRHADGDVASGNGNTKLELDTFQEVIGGTFILF
jgi:predicted porin